MATSGGYAIAHRKFYKVGSSRFDFGIAKNSVLSGVLVVSKPEQPSEQDKPDEKQMIVEGLLFVFVLVPAILFVFSMIITDYLAQTPPVRSFDDAARNSKTLCESSKQNEGGDPGDCRK
ncbi:hypothetical protein IQ274_32155 [Nostoc sp. LEGE 12447]|uniref:hypothetical protein n=1 Tax=Nostoc sp. LEGE 12447 TaxID=1828640 RepID=UPI001883B6CF|nr:hypothetical protein [Nostoc sp. LEGE 12447]MBE9002711.1 hypothetical protein [Nostoc sp. LEGE 12447]